jgi:hypothetical protein
MSEEKLCLNCCTSGDTCDCGDSRVEQMTQEEYHRSMDELLLTIRRREVWLQPLAKKYGIAAQEIVRLVDEVARKEEWYSGPFGAGNFARDFPEAAERLNVNRKITVNGTQHSVQPRTLSYEEVVKLAFSGPFDKPPIEGFLYTMTYFWQGRLDDEPKAIVQGVLSPGKSVVVRDGMRFSVADTSSA